MKAIKNLSWIITLSILSSCASGGGSSSDAGELESLAASIDSSADMSGLDSEMMITENDIMNSTAEPLDMSGDDLSLEDDSASSYASNELDLGNSMPAEDRAVADTENSWSAASSGSGPQLAVTASGGEQLYLMETPWLSEFSSTSLGFDCEWKTVKDNGKVRHRVCVIGGKVVVNLLEKDRGTGLQLAKVYLDERGKAAFNRWKKALTDANYIYHKDRNWGSSKTASRFMSRDHRTHVDLVWNSTDNAATFIMFPTAKGLGREMKRVAGY